MTRSTSTATEPELGPGPAMILAIGLALFALAGATYALSKLELGHWSVVVALAIAVLKAALVVLFFMELASHSGGAKTAVITAGLLLGLLITLTLTDVLLRFAPTVPPGFTPPTDPALPATLSRGPGDDEPVQAPSHAEQGPVLTP